MSTKNGALAFPWVKVLSLKTLTQLVGNRNLLLLVNHKFFLRFNVACIKENKISDLLLHNNKREFYDQKKGFLKELNKNYPHLIVGAQL